jgi:hypothetical protein
VNAELRETRAWARVGSGFDIVAKLVLDPRAEFCGYYLTPYGAFRNPKLLALKTLWHIHHGDSASVDVNYAAEALTCYRMGDRIHSLASPVEVECLGWLLEYYHQERPALARHFFSDSAPPRPTGLPAWMLEGSGNAAERRAVAARLLGEAARLGVKGLSQSVFNYYFTLNPHAQYHESS